MAIKIEPATGLSSSDPDLLLNPAGSLFLKPAFRQALAREFRLEAVNLLLQFRGQHITIPAYRKYSAQCQRLIIGAGFDKSGEFILPADSRFSDCINALVLDLQQQKSATHLEIRSKYALPSVHNHSDKVELSIRPDKPVEQWIMDFSKSTRRNIRLPFKRGFHFRFGNEQQYLDAFYTLYLQHMHELGSLAHSYAFFYELWNNCYDDINLCIGYLDSKAVIASFQFLSADEVYSAWVGIDSAYKQSNVFLGLIWSLTEFSQQNGQRHYNLGRSSSGSGAYQLKKRLATHEQRIHYYQLDLRTGKSTLPGRLKAPVYKGAAQVIRNSPPQLMHSLSRHFIHRFY